MYRIALTGSVCSGKTLTAKNFELLGVPVFYADSIIKFLINHRIDVTESIKKQFGDRIYTNNLIDENKINDALFDQLINLVEYDVFVAFDSWCNKQKSPYVIYESSIIFERKINKAFDYNICVFAPKDERAFRFHRLNKDKFTITGVNSAINKEYDEYSKTCNSDFVIHNYDTFSLENQVSSIHRTLLDKNQSGINLTNSLKNNI